MIKTVIWHDLIRSFDIPLLRGNVASAGVDFDMKNRVSVDVQTVFIKWKSEL
jgi:hypothetical protein